MSTRREQPNALTLNAPATATTVTAAVTAFVLALGRWALSAVPESVPEEVQATGSVVALLVLGLVAWRIGRFAQRWTYPQVEDPAIAALGAEPLPPIGGQTDRRAGQMVRPQLGDVPDVRER